MSAVPSPLTLYGVATEALQAHQTRSLALLNEASSKKFAHGSQRFQIHLRNVKPGVHIRSKDDVLINSLTKRMFEIGLDSVHLLIVFICHQI
jgi:hypothetical protein